MPQPLGPKKTPDQMAKAIHRKDRDVRAAIHKVLEDAGIEGVEVHAVQYRVQPNAMTNSGCFPPCDPLTEQCVSVGGIWMCVPLLTGRD